MDRWRAGKVEIVHEEAIQHQSIGKRMNLCRENLHTTAAEHASESMKDSWGQFLVRADRILDCIAIRMEFCPGDGRILRPGDRQHRTR